MLCFTGDINLTDWYFNAGFGIGSRIAAGWNPFRHIERRKGDIWIGNFEGVASSVSIHENGLQRDVFRVEPEVLKKINHFDIYGFANNHAMQHGDDAYRQTVKTLEIDGGGKVFGTETARTHVFTHQNRQVSVTGMSLRIDEFSENPLYWHNPEYSEIVQELQNIPNGTYKILFVHWGDEYIDYPSSAQKKFAHWLLDIGFDCIIGMHPHVLQGYEIYNGKRIYYSLGNFVFDMAGEPCKFGAVVKIDLSTDMPVFKERYVLIEDSSPRIIDEANVPHKYRFCSLNERLAKECNLENYYNEVRAGYAAYRKANHAYIMGNMIKHPIAGIRMIDDFIKRRF